jgi:hypothetical protein
MPHVYVHRQYDETHQTLFEKVGKREEEQAYNGGSEIVHYTYTWNCHNYPCIINEYYFKRKY